MSKDVKEESQGKHYIVDVRNISPLQRAGGNIRKDMGDLKSLAASIKAQGILVPIRAYRDKDKEGCWIAIDGHRRLAAAMMLVEEGIQVSTKIITVNYQNLTDEQIIYDMVTTNSGQPLNTVEIADAVVRLLGYENTHEQIAAKFGKNLQTIKNLEIIGRAPQKIKKHIISGGISATLVMNTIKETKNPDEALKVIEEAISANGAAEPSKNGKKPAKVTKKALDKHRNKINSFKSLKTIFKKPVEGRKVKDQSLYDFAQKLAENSLSDTQINEMLFEAEQAG